MKSSARPRPPAVFPLEAQALSNGRYTVLLTGAGAGSSSCGGTLLTAWTGDRVEDADGLFVYLRDRDGGTFWSAGLSPCGGDASSVRVRREPGTFRVRRREHGIASELACCVDPSRDAEVRRLTLRNVTRVRRTIEVTAYAELVLQSLPGHLGHPAFSKLFVQTEFLPGPRALVASRRPRSHGESTPWIAVTLSGPGALEHESDRVRFLGRGRGVRNPVALVAGDKLSATSGSVLDPVAALRRTVPLAPGAAVTLDLVVAFGGSRDDALASLGALASPKSASAAFVAARRREAALRKRLGLGARAAEDLQRLAGAMLYASPEVRAPELHLRRAKPGSPDFGAVGLRGGVLHAIARIGRRAGLSRIRRLVVAQAYWQACGVAVDWLLLTGPGSDAAAIADDERRRVGNRDAIVAVREEATLDRATLDRVLAAADLFADGELPGAATSPVRTPSAARAFVLARAEEGATPRAPALAFDNGYGGFATDGDDYVIRVGPDPGDRPPMPWANVLANEHFGFLATESGAANTWNQNSRQNRLTPWSNDPVSDPHGEALYVRDLDAGTFWSPLPGPVDGGGVFEVRHGLARSTWRHESQGLEQEVVAFVPRHDPVKVTRVRLRNPGPKARRLSLVSFSRLVLGVLPRPAVVTEIDPRAAILLASTPFRDEFPEGLSFAAAVAPRGASTRIASDRAAFLGPRGSMSAPAAIRDPASHADRGGAGQDAAAILDVALEIPPNGEAECTFLLGEVTSPAAARALVARYREPGAVDRALDGMRELWSTLRGAIEIESPSAALDRMLNGWLLHQLVSCRLWGRTAFYQSGGAFGFRDQLQDSAALVYARPDLMREQILLHAAHQFPEGDVLHWWHTPSARGTRTRCSDDLLWLPYLATFYARTTGDDAIFDAPAGFVGARSLVWGEDETFLASTPLLSKASLYEHCCLALDRSLARGVHGLPLIGTCDWNDGMNRVGREGRGESVWMAFFLAATLDAFVPHCERRGEAERVARYRRHRAELAAAVESEAWDGEWYRRGYYDDGTPLGSKQSEECKIDALAQSWAVISGLADPERARTGMASAARELVREDDGLIRLLTPPFDHAPEDPGYIKGYVPGIRENGGQYTHAALWVVRAFAELGDGARATRLLEMLTPIAHTRSRERADVYKVEPYVVAADVYGAAPHVGRGGWTWYTGSASWMYRVGLESVLGFTVEHGTRVRIAPHVPGAWGGFTIRYRPPGSRSSYEIRVDNPGGEPSRPVAIEAGRLASGVDTHGAWFALAADGEAHRVRVTLGADPGTVRPSASNT